MNESSLLETTAEVAVAFAGFIGIFLVLTTRDDRFAPGDSLSIRAIVLASVVPVFYCAVPLVLHSLGVSGAMLWRMSSGIIGLAGSAIIAYMVPQLLALSPAERSSLNNLVGSSVSDFMYFLYASRITWNAIAYSECQNRHQSHRRRTRLGDASISFSDSRKENLFE